MDNNDKSILVLNETSDTKIELYCYGPWDLMCLLPSFSKTILPGTSFLYRISSLFKFRLVARAEKTNKTILSTRKWEKNTLFRVTGSASNEMVEESDLIDSCQEKQTCVRRQNMEEECSDSNGYNLYEVLKLDMKEVRSKSVDEQNEMIKKANHREILRWHPDKNDGNGDEYLCKQILIAYKILRKPERRVEYNNVVDYNNGRLLKLKSIFWPECHSDEQKVKFWKRMGLLVFSVGLTIGGVVVNIFTAGLGIPVVILAGAIIEGGIKSGLCTINRVSIEKGCDFKKYAKTMLIGMLAGGLSGGAAVGITSVSIGIEGLLLPSIEIGIGEYIKTGAAKVTITSAVNDLKTICENLKAVFEGEEGEAGEAGEAGKEGEEGEEEECGELLASKINRVRYISQGKWFSKMVVQYSYETKVIKKEVKGSRSSSEIPENATNIEVSFQVERFAGVWCDVKKYNRFEKSWIEPTEPHIFKYAVPTNRTFTLRGGLYFEVVVKVTDEYYEEVDDM